MKEGQKDFTIREALPDDAEALLAYLRQIGGETDNLLFGEKGVPMSVEDEREFLATLQASNSGGMYAALCGGEIVGNAHFQIAQRERIRHRASIGLSVRRSDWSLGIGTTLLERLIKEIRAAGGTVITLEVLADNSRAIRLYEHFGFEIYGTLERYFRIDGIYRAAHHMSLDLD